MAPKHCLDVLHDSCRILFGFPKARTTPTGSALANSVKVRVPEAAGYRPRSLTISPDKQLVGYSVVDVVADP